MFVFQGSEAPYIYALIFIIFFPVVCVGIAYGMMRLRQKHSEDAKRNKKQGYVEFIKSATTWPHVNGLTDKKRMAQLNIATQMNSSKEPVKFLSNVLWAHEWLDSSHSRPVLLKLETVEDKTIQVLDSHDDLLRSISLIHVSKLTIQINKDTDHSK